MNISTDSSLIVTEPNKITKYESSNVRSSIRSFDSIDSETECLPTTTRIKTQAHFNASYDSEGFEVESSTSASDSTRSTTTETTREKTRETTTEDSSTLRSSSFSSSVTSSPISTSNYDDTFETITPRIDSDETFINELDSEGFQDLRKTDYVKYIKIKCKFEQRANQKVLVKEKKSFDKAQIQRLVHRILDKKLDNRPVAVDKTINPHVVNRLRTINSMHRIKENQLKRADDFGKNAYLDFMYSYETLDVDNNQNALAPIKTLSKEIYFQKKCDRVRNKQIEERLAKHHEFYSDGLMLIGDLAATLPKHSDDPEYIWSQLMRPLNEQHSSIDCWSVLMIYFCKINKIELNKIDIFFYISKLAKIKEFFLLIFKWPV